MVQTHGLEVAAGGNRCAAAREIVFWGDFGNVLGGVGAGDTCLSLKTGTAIRLSDTVLVRQRELTRPPHAVIAHGEKSLQTLQML